MEIGNYIAEKLSVWSVELSDDMIAVELARLGLTAQDEIDETTNLDGFFYAIIPEILMMPKSVSESQFSVTFDKEALMAYYRMVAKRLGRSDRFSLNTITDITNRW